MRLNRAKSLFRAFALCLGLCMVSGCQAADTGRPVDPATPRLDLGIIFLHVQEVMNLKEEADQVFVRWERPVRYYLQGLEKHPELERMFEERIQEIARITGLDIKRHDDLYLEYKDPTKRQVGPDGYSTNVTIFFSEDMGAAFQDERIIRIFKGFGSDPEKELSQWKSLDSKSGRPGTLSVERHGFDRGGIKFYFSLADVSFYTKKITEEKKEKLSFNFYRTLFQMISYSKSSNKILSVLNAEAFEKRIISLSEIDKAFLGASYSGAVRSGISKREAALKISEILVNGFAE